MIDPRQPGCAAVAALPWELLFDEAGPGFLCKRVRTSVVRFLDVVAPLPPAQPLRGPLRVLLALASPGALPPLDLATERAVLEAWATPDSGVEIEVLQPATVEALRKRLRRRRYHALHFTGHGDYRRGEESGLLYFERLDGEAEPVAGEFLAALLDDCPALRLVVLNACWSGRIPRRDGRDPYAGVASALVAGGVPAVVAMQFPIGDRAAVRFCRDFYQSLAAGEPVDTAVAEGRRGILCTATPTFEWAAPVLHLRTTDGRLFAQRSGRAGLARRVGFGLALVAAAVAGMLWLDRPRGGEPTPPYQRPAVPEAPGCPPPPTLPGMAFVRIEPGRVELPPQRRGERPRALVVERPFCLGAFETTAGELRTVLGTRSGEPDQASAPGLPAGKVTFDQALEFIRRINDGVAGRPFRLPTGPEWEYATRAGSTSAYAFGDDPAELPRYGNCLSGRPEDDGFDDRPAPVGSFASNRWGLYDLHGNLWEWVDEAAPPEAAETTGGAAQKAPTRRVKRGGSYESRPEMCVSEARSEVRGDYEVGINGFRLARDVEP
jgi:hypothetical protein